MFSALDVPAGLITREEFRMHMRNDAMVSYMASVGLEMHDVELLGVRRAESVRKEPFRGRKASYSCGVSTRSMLKTC